MIEFKFMIVSPDEFQVEIRLGSDLGLSFVWV